MMAAGQPEVDVLRRELQDFRAKYTGTGQLTFSHRDGAHDDLLLSLAIGFWWSSRKRAHYAAVPIVGWQ
jgi:hypothetical protein